MVNPVDLVINLDLYLLCGEKGSVHSCVVLCKCVCVSVYVVLINCGVL